MRENVYNMNLRFVQDDKVVYINGNQIVKIEVSPPQAIIYLSNGSQYDLIGAAADNFIAQVEGIFDIDPSLRYKPENFPEKKEGLPPFMKDLSSRDE